MMIYNRVKMLRKLTILIVIYRYENNQVGLEDITFYMKDNKVYYLHFGKAIDKNEAKNDKYLNQIINN